MACSTGDGTKESNSKVQEALNSLWQYTGELFEMDQIDNEMLEKGIGVDNFQLKDQWDKLIDSTLTKAKLKRPLDGSYMATGSKKGIHTEHLGFLLAEMQFLPRAYPNAKW